MPGLINSGPTRRDAAAGPEGDIMHPMFAKLFLESDADDLPPEEDRRRRARRSRPAMVVRPATVAGSTRRGRDR